MHHEHPHADLDLARKLERTEGLACAAIVQSRARRSPTSTSCWHDFGGTCAMFDGAGSPMTQAFGFGVFDDPQGHELDAIQAFFHGHSTKSVLEISPLAGIATTNALQQRDYRIIEMSSVLCRPSAGGVSRAPTMASRLGVRVIDVRETEVWAGVAASGWGSESDEIAGFIHELGRAIVPAERMISFLAELDGVATVMTRPVGNKPDQRAWLTEQGQDGVDHVEVRALGAASEVVDLARYTATKCGVDA